MRETQVWSLGQEDPLEKRMVTHSSILYWENSMDRGVWQAIVHGVVKNQMQLSDFEQESIWGHKILWLWEAVLYKLAFLISVQLMLVKPLSFWVVTTETVSRNFHLEALLPTKYIWSKCFLLVKKKKKKKKPETITKKTLLF